jgi:hypothetical protein
MAFAECACNQHYCRPNLREDTALTIQGGRHPLAELVTNTYIPNDTKMGLEDERLHIITGPNASVSSNQIWFFLNFWIFEKGFKNSSQGKSCYIKQVALIVYLAHVGAFVPAQKADIGLVDHIFTRLVSQSSTSVPQSTFFIDLSQVSVLDFQLAGVQVCWGSPTAILENKLLISSAWNLLLKLLTAKLTLRRLLLGSVCVCVYVTYQLLAKTKESEWITHQNSTNNKGRESQENENY